MEVWMPPPSDDATGATDSDALDELIRRTADDTAGDDLNDQQG